MSKVDEIKHSILHYGASARGRKELTKHLNGKRLTQRQAILAKCYDCCGYYSDGKESCQIEECPLFPLMPYRGKGADQETPDENGTV